MGKTFKKEEFRWSDVYKLSIYDRRRSTDYKIPLSDSKGSNLSPYTNLVLNTSLRLIEKGFNLTIVTPKFCFKPTPLLGYLLANTFCCDVEIVTNNYTLQEHLNTYCLLADDRKQGSYAFTYIPPIVVGEERAKPYFYIPRAKKDIKQKLTGTVLENLHNTNRVMFIQKNIFLPKSLTKLEVNKEEIEIELEPQIFIVEYGAYYLKYPEYFIEWYDSLGKEKLSVVLFVSGSLDDRVTKLAKSINSEVLYFSPSLFHATREFVYSKYRKELERKRVYLTNRGWELLNKLNFDDEWDYNRPELEIVRIGGFQELSECLRDIRRTAHIIINSTAPYHIKWLAEFIKETTENLIGSYLPPEMKVVFDYENVRLSPVLEFIKGRVNQALEKVTDQKLRVQLKILYENFNRIYRNLNSTRRPHKGENLRDSKYITLLEILDRKEPRTKYYVLSLHDFKSRLEDTIAFFLKNKGKDMSDIIVYTPKDLIRDHSKIDDSSVLILSAPLPPSYVLLLQSLFRKIIFLVYSNIEKDEYLEDLRKFEIFEVKQSIDTIHRIHRVLQIEPPKVFVNLFDKLVDKYGLGTYLKEVMEMKEEIATLENKIYKSSIPEQSQAERTAKKYKLVLKSKNRKETKTIVCVYYKPILKLESQSGVIEETTIEELREGEVVCLIDGDERKHLVDLVSEIFTDEEIDVELIKYWQTKLKKYILDKGLSISELYHIYKATKGDNIKDYQTVRQWVHGGVFGPRDLDDLRVIAEIIEDDFLTKNCEQVYKELKKLRNLHRLVGRKLNKVLKGLLTSDLSTISSFDEKLLLNKLKFYDVVAKTEET